MGRETQGRGRQTVTVRLVRVRIYRVFFHCMNQSIKMHLELSHYSRYGAENVYIFIISYSYHHTKSDVFFSKSQHNYKRDIDFKQQFNKQEVNMKRLTF